MKRSHRRARPTLWDMFLMWAAPSFAAEIQVFVENLQQLLLP